MKLLTLIYILNATLLILHEIESAFVKEWEILKLPGRITGFLLLHVPIVIILLAGVIWTEEQTVLGLSLALLAGIGGTVPFLVHKIVVRREGYFELFISNSLIYLNLLTGILTAIIAASMLLGWQ